MGILPSRFIGKFARISTYGSKLMGTSDHTFHTILFTPYFSHSADEMGRSPLDRECPRVVKMPADWGALMLWAIAKLLGGSHR